MTYTYTFSVPPVAMQNANTFETILFHNLKKASIQASLDGAQLNGEPTMTSEAFILAMEGDEPVAKPWDVDSDRSPDGYQIKVTWE